MEDDFDEEAGEESTEPKEDLRVYLKTPAGMSVRYEPTVRVYARRSEAFAVAVKWLSKNGFHDRSSPSSWALVKIENYS